MNSKVEIFKLALNAGSVELTEEQLRYVVECFITAEKLSSGKGSQVKRREKIRRPKTLNGRTLFIKDKITEIKDNGNDYLINEAIAVAIWGEIARICI